MKLAIINQNASTGGWGYLLHLVKGFLNVDKNLDITLYITNPAIKTTMLDEDDFKFDRVTIKSLPDNLILFREKEQSKNKFINKILNSYQKKLADIKNIQRAKDIENFEDEINKFDCVFYSWPYGIEPYNTKIPMFYVPHDFAFSHFFGCHYGESFCRREYHRNKERLGKFIDKGKAIVSTPFIKREMERVFPNAKYPASVVFLSRLDTVDSISEEKEKEIIKKFDLPKDYILYANNASVHKNMQQALGGFYYVKQKYPSMKLIITGHGTGHIYGKINSSYYMDHAEYEDNYDIKSLGFVDNDEMYVVFKNAKMIINSSLCEAGSGSALNAWSLGIPAILSDLPSFREQVEFLGTKAVFFDPRDAKSIAEAASYVIDNPDKIKEDVEISKEAMKKYTWDDVARGYLEVFKGKENA